ncbi:MAG: ribokinase [Chloroflexi bacterium]|nr:ribokinase [Chloroflexota bacterium]
MPARVVVVGSLNMDLIVRTPRMPAPGETILGGRFGTAPGGKGANQAVAAARLGGAVRMIGRVGRDGYGEELRATLARDGVDVARVGVDPDAATGVAFIAVDDSSQNSIIVASGANMRVSAADVDAARDVIAGAGMLVLQLEVPLEANERAIAIARAAGVPVILNPAPARPLPAGLIAQVDYLIPNESEASLLTGVNVSDVASAETAARQLMAQGARTVIVTLGAKGALVVEVGGATLLPPFAVKAVDTTAAGDAFVGALSVALAQGMPLAGAARFASAAGALTVTKPGAQPSLPRLADVQALLGA